jgi:hypothetical protein
LLPCQSKIRDFVTFIYKAPISWIKLYIFFIIVKFHFLYPVLKLYSFFVAYKHKQHIWNRNWARKKENAVFHSLSFISKYRNRN